MERICLVCSGHVNDDDTLRDKFGVNYDIHAKCFDKMRNIWRECHFKINKDDRKAERYRYTRPEEL